jgi:hypothetical protein
LSLNIKENIKIIENLKITHNQANLEKLDKTVNEKKLLELTVELQSQIDELQKDMDDME